MDGIGLKTKLDSYKNNLYLLFIIFFVTYGIYSISIFDLDANLHCLSEPFNYSYLLLLISVSWLTFNLYSIYRSDQILIEPTILPVLGVLLCIMVCFIAYVGQMLSILQVSMLLCLWLVVWTFFGWKIARYNIMPFVLLLSAMPIVEILVSFESIVIKHFLVFNLDLLGMVSSSSNNIVETYNALIEMGQDLTGARYINLILISTLIYSNFIFRKLKSKVVFVLSSLAISFILVLTRALVTVTYIHYTSLNGLSISWVTYDLLFLLFVFLSILLSSKLIKNGYYIKEGAKTRSSNLLALPGYLYDHSPDHSYKVNSNIYVVSVFLFMILAGLTIIKNSYHDVSHSIPLANILGPPNITSFWENCNYCSSDNWHPVIGKPDAKLISTYKQVKTNKFLDFYLGYYEHQYVGNTLITYNNDIFGKKWRDLNNNEKLIKIKSIHTFKDVQKVDYDKIVINQALLKGDYKNRVVWYWYWINHTQTNNRTHAKVLEIFDIFHSLKTHSALIAVSSEYKTDLDLINAEATLYDFINDNYANLYPMPRRRAIVVGS